MKRNIDREAYLAHAKSFTEAERRLVEEFAEWLPETIIDGHSHGSTPEHVRAVDARAYGHMLSTFPSFTLEESDEWHRILYPGKTVHALRFAMPFRGIDHKEANRYLLGQSMAEDRIALYGLPDDVEYTIGMLGHPRVSALKMYYSYHEPPAGEIYQYFPKEVLEQAQALGVPILLHPPMRITACLDQILTLVRDFPRLRVCLAHLSLTKYAVPGLEEAFVEIAKHPQISFDTALVPSAEVVAMALRIVGSDRIMYGSDEPLQLIRSVPYAHPQRGERLATDYPYHWVDLAEHGEYGHLAAGAPHAHWQALGAIRMAVSGLSETERASVKQKLFHDNAKAFYGF
ncbi:hypothetical protein EPO34_02810 [Patescibacteria group bacterium]|nr:MAG: hypothetical protein EPO34_02810 [Patescibacteria group bacterium]